jgi:hypothetical protein
MLQVSSIVVQKLCNLPRGICYTVDASKAES